MRGCVNFRLLYFSEEEVGVGLTAGQEELQKNCFANRELNPDSSVIYPVTYSLYRFTCPCLNRKEQYPPLPNCIFFLLMVEINGDHFVKQHYKGLVFVSEIH